MNWPNITISADKATLTKWAGGVVTAALVIAGAKGWLGAGTIGELITVAGFVGLWVLPSPGVRTEQK